MRRCGHEHLLQLPLAGPSGLASLDAESEEGRAYLQDLDVALAFAEANREALLLSVGVALEVELDLQPLAETWRTCQHNHVRQERWGGASLWVHRKGAIPA